MKVVLIITPKLMEDLLNIIKYHIYYNHKTVKIFNVEHILALNSK